MFCPWRWWGPAGCQPRSSVSRPGFRSPFGASSARGTVLFSAGNMLWMRKVVSEMHPGAKPYWVTHPGEIGVVAVPPSRSPTQNGLY